MDDEPRQDVEDNESVSSKETQCGSTAEDVAQTQHHVKQSCDVHLVSDMDDEPRQDVEDNESVSSKETQCGSTAEDVAQTQHHVTQSCDVHLVSDMDDEPRQNVEDNESVSSKETQCGSTAEDVAQTQHHVKQSCDVHLVSDMDDEPRQDVEDNESVSSKETQCGSTAEDVAQTQHHVTQSCDVHLVSDMDDEPRQDVEDNESVSSKETQCGSTAEDVAQTQHHVKQSCDVHLVSDMDDEPRQDVEDNESVSSKETQCGSTAEDVAQTQHHVTQSCDVHLVSDMDDEPRQDVEDNESVSSKETQCGSTAEDVAQTQHHVKQSCDVHLVSDMDDEPRQDVEDNESVSSKETQCGSTAEDVAQTQHQLALHVKQLLAEKLALEERGGEESNQFSLTYKLLMQELERLQNGCRPFTGASKFATEERRFADIIKDKPIKVTIRVLVPAKEHPKFNFVGKLLGPKGNSLKRLQEDTMTKMAILGRGSMRDKHKEEELRMSRDPKFSHLNDELHVEVTAFAPPAEAHARIAYALAEVRRFLVPDYNDDIRQGQMREMQLLNTSTPTPCDVADAELSPSTSPGGAVKTGGRAASYQQQQQQQQQQAARNCFLYNQQVLMHPAFRGPLPARSHDPMHQVFRSNGSLLNRLPQLVAPNKPLLPAPNKQRGSSILSILAGGPRLFADHVTGEASAGDDVLLADQDVVGVVSAAGLFGFGPTNGSGYALLDGFGNGTNLLTDDITMTQDGVNGGLTVELGVPRTDAAGSVKMDRPRYRHDPYGRFQGIKLPL